MMHAIQTKQKGRVMKYLLVVLDGAPDRPNPILNGKTPLEYAKMENLNRLAKNGLAGEMYSVGKGIAPESDAAVFSILGYNVKKYTGRGPLEALGAGIKINSNTLALRTNFATIDSKRHIIDRRAGRNVTAEEAKRLEKEINTIKLNTSSVYFKFKATVGHRGVVAFYPKKGIKLSANISNGDVAYVKKGSISIALTKKEASAALLPKIKPLDNSKSASFTADMLNDFIDKVIDKLAESRVNKERRKRGLPEANALLLRDAGIGLPKVEPINKKFGMKFAFITEMPVETGIAKLLGMKKINLKIKEKEKNKVEEYKTIAEVVRRNASSCDFMYVHIKGPDEPGHDGDAIEKARRLSAIDSGFFANIASVLDNVVMCVTADHATPCTLKAHSADPIPVAFYCKNSSKKDNMPLDEKIDGKGSLGIFTGTMLIPKLIAFGNKCIKQKQT